MVFVHWELVPTNCLCLVSYITFEYKSKARITAEQQTPRPRQQTHVDTDSGESGGHVLLGGRGVSAEHKEHVGSQVTHLYSAQASTTRSRVRRETGGCA